MTYSVQPTPIERILLLHHYKKAQILIIRERAHTIMLNAKGYSIPQVAKIFFKSEKTIREWIKGFQRERVASIFPKTLGNQHAAKLTIAQKQQLKKVLEKPPEENGITGKFWDVSKLRYYVKAEFGVEYESGNSIRLLFKLHNWSFHLPYAFDRHRNEEHIRRRIQEIKKEITPYIQDSNWLVFVSDECRIIWETEIRRMWLPKGQKTVIKVERKRKAQSFIGLLNLKDGKEWLYRLAWQKQDTIIPVLEALVKQYPGKRICIIWDNARFHHGKKLKAKLQTTLKTIHLINLPAYAPDHNPQEHVWKYGKESIANDQRNSLEETVQAFEDAVMGRNYNYQF